MRVAWVGGPLDGAVDRSENMPPLQTLWYGPDLSEPLTKVIVYGLFTDGDNRKYVYDPALTASANQHLAELAGLRSEEAGSDGPGGQDGTGDDRGDPVEDRRCGGATGERDSGGT